MRDSGRRPGKRADDKSHYDRELFRVRYISGGFTVTPVTSVARRIGAGRTGPAEIPLEEDQGAGRASCLVGYGG